MENAEDHYDQMLIQKLPKFFIHLIWIPFFLGFLF